MAEPQKEPDDQDIAKVRQMLTCVSEDYTESLIQNHEILGPIRRIEANLVKALHLLDREQPAYAPIFAAWNDASAIKRAEESEDLRQKGIAGVFDRHVPTLKRILKAFVEGQKEREGLKAEIVDLRARLEAANAAA